MANTYKVRVSLKRLEQHHADYFVEAEDRSEAIDTALTLAEDEFGAEWDDVQVQPRHVRLAEDGE